MPDLAFVSDLPDVLTLGAGKACSRIQIAKTGKFKDPRYGNFSITTAMFDKWEANFAALSSPSAGRKGIPIDFDHAPEKRGETEAAGWIVGLDRKGRDGKTPTADELWGKVEWTQLGVDAIKDGRYAYISPSYAENYVDEAGKQHGTHLVGSALTNRPFLRMATVSLSAAPFAVEDGDVVVDSPRHMPELNKQLLTSLGLSDEKADTVLAAEDTGAALKVALAEVATPEPAPAPEATPEQPKYGGKTLAELASENGMVIMPGADVAKLAADAALGAAAAKTLHENTFSTAWDTAVEKGKVLPVSKPAFELAYGADATATLKQLSDLPEGTIKVTLDGDGGGGSEDTVTVDHDTKRALAEINAGGSRVGTPDNERLKMAKRLDALRAEGKSEDEAFEIAEREFEGAVA